MALVDEPGVERPPVKPGWRVAKRLSEQDQRRIIERYQAGGQSVLGLAKEYGLSDYSVRVLLRQAGIGPVRQKLTPEQTAQVRRLAAGGVGVADIAEGTGVSQTAVRLILAQS